MGEAKGRNEMDNPSYRRKEPFLITDEIRREIAGAIGEIDLAQMAIISKADAGPTRPNGSFHDRCL